MNEKSQSAPVFKVALSHNGEAPPQKKEVPLDGMGNATMLPVAKSQMNMPARNRKRANRVALVVGRPSLIPLLGIAFIETSSFVKIYGPVPGRNHIPQVFLN